MKATLPGGGLGGEEPPAAVLSLPSTQTPVGVSAKDEAIYQCVGENTAGSNQAGARLAVTGDPGPPPAPRGLWAMTLSTSATRVSWEPSHSDRDIIGYVLHLQPVGGGYGWVNKGPWFQPTYTCDWCVPWQILLSSQPQACLSLSRLLGLWSSGASLCSLALSPSQPFSS